jgi:hypothetical protein
MQESDLQEYVARGDEESLTLDYKAADSLGKNDLKKKEITKDVSAFANSAGGRIIYGIREYADAARRHLPERLDPFDGREFTKEWLEHVIAGVRPRIDGLVIYPVRLSTGPNDAAYVVDIPQSSTAHQAVDLRYYRRYNFESVPMYDHEIRDVMGRAQFPRIDIGFHIEQATVIHRPIFGSGPERSEQTYSLVIAAGNVGERLAQYISGSCLIPADLVTESERSQHDRVVVDGREMVSVSFDNTRRDVVGTGGVHPHSYPLYGPSWYEPVLPQLEMRLTTVLLDLSAPEVAKESVIEWSVSADNAPPRSGQAQVAEIRYEVMDE